MEKNYGSHIDSVDTDTGVSDHSNQLQPHHHAIAPNSAMRHTTILMACLAMFVGLGGFILNFDIGYTGAVLVMPPFNKSFGSCTISPTTKLSVCALSPLQQSLGSSIYLIFLAVGTALSGLSSNYVGPRGALQVGCVWISIGAAGMVGSAGNFTAYVACKCIGAVGLGHLQVMGVTYAIECAPPSKRGLLSTLFVVGSTTGNLVATCVCLSTQYYPTNWSWQTPIICQIPLAILFGCGLFIFPQSPRWLLTKDKADQARRSFSRLYNRDAASEEVILQVKDVQMTIAEEKEMSSTSNWTEIFHRNFIRRTLIAMLINSAAPLGGAFFIFSYAAIFLRAVGIGSPLQISVVINACVVLGGMSGPLWVEYLGRRRSLLTGYSVLATCMIIFSATSSGLGGAAHGPARSVLIAFICIWAYGFGGFIASTQFMASTEMHAVRLRNYGQPFTSTVGNVFAFGATFWGPYQLSPKYGNEGTNVGYFYFGLEVIALVLMFFFVPENARLTLEQIDEYFRSGRPARKTSLARNKKIARGEIDIMDP